MDKKQLFNEALTTIVEFATACGNEITKEDVELHFKNLIDDESQYQLVYDYLSANKIKVKGVNISANNAFENTDSKKEVLESEEELAFIKMYMDEMSSLEKISKDEQMDLVAKLSNGNMDVVHQLVESYLLTVAEIAEEYRNQGTTFGDLIGEGNTALMLAVSAYDPSMGEFDTYIKKELHSTLKDIVESQVSSNRIGEHLADKLNILDKVTKELSEKLGRVPEIKELAKAMSVTEEEAEILLKTSLDTLSVNEDTQITNEKEIDNSSSNSKDNYKEILKSSSNDPLQWRFNK